MEDSPALTVFMPISCINEQIYTFMYHPKCMDEQIITGISIDEIVEEYKSMIPETIRVTSMCDNRSVRMSPAGMAV